MSITAIGSYETGVFDKSAAEIVAFHAESNRVLTANAQAGKIDVLDVTDPTDPKLLFPTW
ncbi:hypothetical protein [Corynebacterium qintianiae]|uniref:hypothetical protein n=1 Tax=Corynebacterium qintianiae TaxID=2709392 RepID=UPI0020170768|nr:hypothetical protein [Corynebacterium qintianiae]